MPLVQAKENLEKTGAALADLEKDHKQLTKVCLAFQAPVAVSTFSPKLDHQNTEL